MNFNKELEEIFDIDLWELKPQYRTRNQVFSEDLEQESEDSLNKNYKVQTTNIQQLIYSNNISSSKEINIFVSNDLNIEFFRKLIEALFFKSKVNLYKLLSSKTEFEEEGINLYETDFVSSKHDLLSPQSKRYILANLYQYADFNSK